MAGTAERGEAGLARAATPVAAPWPAPVGATLRARLLRWRPPRIALALALAAMALHALAFGLQAPWGRAPALGIGLAAAGLGWMLWAWAAFRRAGTPILPTATPRVLVDEGPFAFGRHPMYLGITTAWVGAALALGAPFVAAAAAAFVAIVRAAHIPHEEAQLRRAFGGWYSDYAARVRRWF